MRSSAGRGTVRGAGDAPPSPPQSTSANATSIATKRFQCSACGLRFRRTEHLLRHTLTHSGERPFRCRVCSRTFARADAHHRHLRVHAASTSTSIPSQPPTSTTTPDPTTTNTGGQRSTGARAARAAARRSPSRSASSRASTSTRSIPPHSNSSSRLVPTTTLATPSIPQSPARTTTTTTTTITTTTTSITSNATSIVPATTATTGSSNNTTNNYHNARKHSTSISKGSTSSHSTSNPPPIHPVHPTLTSQPHLNPHQPPNFEKQSHTNNPHYQQYQYHPHHHHRNQYQYLHQYQHQYQPQHHQHQQHQLQLQQQQQQQQQHSMEDHRDKDHDQASTLPLDAVVLCPRHVAELLFAHVAVVVQGEHIAYMCPLAGCGTLLTSAHLSEHQRMNISGEQKYQPQLTVRHTDACHDAVVRDFDDLVEHLAAFHLPLRRCVHCGDQHKTGDVVTQDALARDLVVACVAGETPQGGLLDKLRQSGVTLRLRVAREPRRHPKSLTTKTHRGNTKNTKDDDGIIGVGISDIGVGVPPPHHFLSSVFDGTASLCDCMANHGFDPDALRAPRRGPVPRSSETQIDDDDCVGPDNNVDRDGDIDHRHNIDDDDNDEEIVVAVNDSDTDSNNNDDDRKSFRRTSRKRPSVRSRRGIPSTRRNKSTTPAAVGASSSSTTSLVSSGRATSTSIPATSILANVTSPGATPHSSRQYSPPACTCPSSSSASAPASVIRRDSSADCHHDTAAVASRVHGVYHWPPYPPPQATPHAGQHYAVHQPYSAYGYAQYGYADDYYWSQAYPGSTYAPYYSADAAYRSHDAAGYGGFTQEDGSRSATSPPPRTGGSEHSFDFASGHRYGPPPYPYPYGVYMPQSPYLHHPGAHQTHYHSAPALAGPPPPPQQQQPLPQQQSSSVHWSSPPPPPSGPIHQDVVQQHAHQMHQHQQHQQQQQPYQSKPLLRNQLQASPQPLVQAQGTHAPYYRLQEYSGYDINVSSRSLSPRGQDVVSSKLIDERNSPRLACKTEMSSPRTRYANEMSVSPIGDNNNGDDNDHKQQPTAPLSQTSHEARTTLNERFEDLTVTRVTAKAEGQDLVE